MGPDLELSEKNVNIYEAIDKALKDGAIITGVPIIRMRGLISVLPPSQFTVGIYKDRSAFIQHNLTGRHFSMTPEFTNYLEIGQI